MNLEHEEITFTGGEAGAMASGIAFAIAFAERSIQEKGEDALSNMHIQDLFRGVAKLITLTFSTEYERTRATEIFSGTLQNMRDYVAKIDE